MAGNDKAKSVSEKKPARSSKTAAAKKSVAGSKPASAADAKLTALIAELLGVAKDLGEEELEFLLNQARIFQGSRALVEQERALEAAAEKPPAKGKGKSKSAPAAKITAVPMRIERSSDGGSFHVVSNDKWKMFTRSEMTALVKIAAVPDPVGEVAVRLYRWLDRERRDAFGDLEIGGPSDPKMAELVALLRSTFKLGK